MAGTDRALSYHDVLLRRQDVDLLRGDHWLNDQVGARQSARANARRMGAAGQLMTPCARPLADR
jgi:hypothetical protein